MIKFYICSLIVMVIAIIVFVTRFEASKKEIGIMSAIIATYMIIGMAIISFRPTIKESFRDVSSGRIKEIDKKRRNEPLYVEGYLKAGAVWRDLFGNLYKNSYTTKVEIWTQRIVVADGGELIQIYFLEGKYIGFWGYTTENFLSR